MSQRNILITDFDGTMTERDFYTCAVDQLLTQTDLQPWLEYTDGRITHFEALRRIFERIRASPPQIELILQAMNFDRLAASSLHRLANQRWDVVVVSNGCGWYIRKLFDRYGLSPELHTNPGTYSEERGLQMGLPVDSKYFDEETGVSKTAVVSEALQAGHVVAFAGDGRPDLEPALMVPESLRFATGWLAAELDSKGEPYRSFSRWSDITTMILENQL